jgi:hypothetical protein
MAAQADHLDKMAGVFWQDRELAGAYKTKAAEKLVEELVIAAGPPLPQLARKAPLPRTTPSVASQRPFSGPRPSMIWNRGTCAY